CVPWEDGTDAYDARCGTGEATAFATFVTGSDRDTTPPAFSGLERITLRKVEGIDGCYQGFEGQGVSLSLAWSPESASAAADHYFRVRLDDRVIGHVFGSEAWVAFSCDGQPWQSQLRNGGGMMETPIAGGTGRYRVTAVDFAGNEDDNGSVIEIGGSCSKILDGLGDDGTAVVTPAEPASEGGCAVAAGRNGEGGRAAALTALLLAAGLLQRRRVRSVAAR